MRAVNLVPKDYRRGALAGKGGETLSYFVIAGLGVLLIAVVAIVLTNNSISDKKAEIARLQQEEADTRAQADALQPYANFAAIQEARTATVSSLAQSRFDWERALQELSRVVPSDIELLSLTGTVLPDVQVENGVSVQTRASVAGPALEITGCSAGQEQVAALVAALEDIDGVTRVGLNSSETSGVGSESAGGGGGNQDCPEATQFEIVAAFDAAPAPPETGELPALPAPTTPQPDGGVGEARRQRASEQEDVASTGQKTKQATNLIPGG